jgi:LmbE family N-acetylglucosaminyl deacetylase
MAEGPNLDVLAVAPHPDDLEILCGGTLAKLVLQGHRVAILDLTTGEPTPAALLNREQQKPKKPDEFSVYRNV